VIRIARAGAIDVDLLELIAHNTRDPEERILDLKTQIGSNARGAEMLSLMLGFGIVSRLLSGWIADHIGGLRTLLLGSALQGVALCGSCIPGRRGNGDQGGVAW
jgi:hypothetical protein